MADIVGLNDGENVGVRVGLKVGSTVGDAEGLLAFSSTMKEKKLEPVAKLLFGAPVANEP